MVEEKKKGRMISIKNGERKISIKNGKYYHEEEGVYIGPAHTFDDEGLEDESFEKITPSPPIVNCLSIGSMAGFYIGFPEKVKNEVQKNETRDINDIQVIMITEENERTTKLKMPKKGQFFFKTKKTNNKENNGNICFKLFGK
eukprot:GFUD01084755.1.p1 GENE.GFUD01084755.1~~GFUD01084755.1.p1  ORF type:complete len:143 (-),score=48.83 GFUD01084755.1:216-644(-)